MQPPVKMSSWLLHVQILQTGQEIMELDTSGFATQGPTVFAGNIGENKYIIQVSPMGIRLLEGGRSWSKASFDYLSRQTI